MVERVICHREQIYVHEVVWDKSLNAQYHVNYVH
jgi:hypothetical protein